MNFINDDTESPHINMLETLFYLTGFLAVVFVLSAIAWLLIYALVQLCKPESPCAVYQWFGGLL